MKNISQHARIDAFISGVVLLLFAVITPAMASLTGKAISTEFNFPKKHKVALGGNPTKVIVGDGVEIAGSPQSFKMASLDFSDSTITVTFSQDGRGAGGDFLGWRFFDASNVLADFSTISLTTKASDAYLKRNVKHESGWTVSYDADNIWLNGAGAKYHRGMKLIINLDAEPGSENATPVPTPAPSVSTSDSNVDRLWDRDKKAWEYEESFSFHVKRNGVSVTLNKITHRNAAKNGFRVNTSDRDKSVWVSFSGVCAQVIEAEARLNNAKAYDLAAYIESQTSKILPVQEPLQLFRQAVAEQCDQLEVIRIKFLVMIHLNQYQKVAGENARMPRGLTTFEGTMAKASQWEIQDGHVATDYDHTQTFTLNYRDAFSVAGVTYSGNCQTDPVLPITHLYQTAAEKTLGKKPSLGTLSAVARDYSALYAQKCPSTKKMRYTLMHIPEDYLCPNTTDCYITTTLKGNQWAITGNDFRSRAVHQPVKDAKDLFNILAAGEFNLLSDYTSFFNFYFEQWFGAYYEHCKAHISDPVGRRYTVLSVSKDGYGTEISEETIVDQTVFLESQYAKDYDRIFSTSHGWVKLKMLDIYMKQKAKGRQPAEAVRNSLGFFTSNVAIINQLIANNCTSDKVLTAQKNMINFARNLPAIKGQYSESPPKNQKESTSERDDPQRTAQAPSTNQSTLPENSPVKTDEKFETTESGLQYRVLKKSTSGGKTPSIDSTVTVHYVMYLSNGDVADDSRKRDMAVTLPLSGVIKGWQEGVKLMREGDTYRFVIPPDLAYGSKGSGRIPANETITYEIELLKVEP